MSSSRVIELFGELAGARLTLEGGEVLEFDVNARIAADATRHAPDPVPVYTDEGEPVRDDMGNPQFQPDDSTLFDVAAELALSYLRIYRPEHRLARGTVLDVLEAMRPPCRLYRTPDFDAVGETGLLDPLAPSG